MQRIMSALLWAVIGAVGVVVVSIGLTFLASIGDPSAGGLGVGLIFLGLPLGLVGGGIYGGFFRNRKVA